MCSSVMAQFGAGRGKLPQAILYPWPQSGSSELCQLVVWAIPYLWPQSSNSVNSSIGIVSPLLECQCQASALTHFPMTLFAFLNLLGQIMELHCIEAFPEGYSHPHISRPVFKDLHNWSTIFVAHRRCLPDRCLETNMGQGPPAEL